MKDNKENYNPIWWLTHIIGIFNWMAGLVIGNMYLYIAGMSLMVGNFLGWLSTIMEERC